MDKDIASGWYCTEDGQTTSVAHWMDEDDFRGNGGVMNHETLETIAKRKKPFTVDYAGFGWLLIKKGCLLYTSPSPRDATLSRMPSSA